MNARLLTEVHTPTGTAPQPLLPETAPPTPYAVDALPSVMREAVEAIVEHELVPAAIAGQCVIGAATHLAQTRVNAWHPKGKSGGHPAHCSRCRCSAAGKVSRARENWPSRQSTKRKRMPAPDTARPARKSRQWPPA